MGNQLVKRYDTPKVAFAQMRAMSKSAGKRTAIVTGANSGMGLQTAISLARSNMRVILGCRNMNAGHKAVEKIRKESENSMIVVHELDLASFTSIRDFSKTVIEQYDQLDVLVNNAGVFMLPLRRTANGIEMHLGVNYLGHFLLTNLLLDKLKESPAARIVNIASRVPPFSMIDFDDLNSEKSYNRVKAVVQSKQAVLLHTKLLSAELINSNVTVNSVDPGLVINEFGRNRDYWYGYFQVRQ